MLQHGDNGCHLWMGPALLGFSVPTWPPSSSAWPCRHLRSQPCFEYVPWPQNKVRILQHGAQNNPNVSLGIMHFSSLTHPYRTTCLFLILFCLHALLGTLPPTCLQLMETPAPIRLHSIVAGLIFVKSSPTKLSYLLTLLHLVVCMHLRSSFYHTRVSFV